MTSYKTPIRILINSVLCIAAAKFLSISKENTLFYAIGFLYSMYNISELQQKLIVNNSFWFILTGVTIIILRIFSTTFYKKYAYFQDIQLEYTKEQLTNHINNIRNENLINYKLIAAIIDIFGWTLFRYMTIIITFKHLFLMKIAILLNCVCDLLETVIYTYMIYNPNKISPMFSFWRTLNVYKYYGGFFLIPPILMSLINK